MTQAAAAAKKEMAMGFVFRVPPGAAAVLQAVLALQVFAACLAAQPAEILAVKKWRFTYTYKAQKAVKTADAEWTYDISARGDFLLDKLKPSEDGEDRDGEWSGYSNARVSIKVTGMTFFGCPISQVMEYSGPSARAEEPDAHLYAGEEGYFITMGNPYVEVKLTTEYHCAGMGKAVETKPERWNTEWPDPIPYPKSGTALSGKLKRTDYYVPIVPMASAKEPVDLEISYTLTPELEEEDVILEIRPSAAYANWRPSASEEGGDGTPVEFTAALKAKKGGAPDKKMESLEWELIETSREPGITINWPRNPASNEPDLYFKGPEQGAGGAMLEIADPDGQKAVEHFVKGGATAGTIKVYPRDWGGWSTLRATAVLTNGRRITGRLAGTEETSVRLPDRDAGRLIARSWLKQAGVNAADESDLDASPEGDGNHGDGLTLYEEYRGFHVNGVRKEGDPKRKEVFILNDGAAPGRSGINLFRRLTGLVVHGDLRSDEISPDRVVNQNSAAAPRLGAQHAIHIVIKPEYQGFAKAYTQTDRPSAPGGIEYVGLPQHFPRRPMAKPGVSYVAAVVAHELLHSVNVYHHGESDEVVFWSRENGRLYEQKTQESGGADTPVGAKTEIRVFLETGEEVTDKARTGFRNLGAQRGQHAGWEDCVMRYDIADTYVSNANPDHRFVNFKEVQGTGLCSQEEGVAANASSHKPQSRFGSAAPNRGSCARQILVSDAVAAPPR